MTESPSDISHLLAYLATPACRVFIPLQAHQSFLVVSLTTFLPLLASLDYKVVSSVVFHDEQLAPMMLHPCSVSTADVTFGLTDASCGSF